MSHAAPIMPIAELTARQYKTIVFGGQIDRAHETYAAVDRWLTILAKHPLVPPEAKRIGSGTRQRLDAHTVHAINRSPWWTITAAQTNPHTGEPEEDPQNPGLYKATCFTAPVPPPHLFLVILDDHSNGALTDRRDGGPKP